MNSEIRHIIISCTRCKAILPPWEKEHICKDIAFNDYRKNRTKQLLEVGFSLKEAYSTYLQVHTRYYEKKACFNILSYTALYLLIMQVISVIF